MIQARKSLTSHIRRFFETELCGLFVWDEAGIYPAPPVEEKPGDKRKPFGKYREVVSVGFGGYVMEVSSSREHPPLGHVELRDDSGVLASGTMDSRAWAQAGVVIRSRESRQRGAVHG